MIITATELKKNLGKYLKLSDTEIIYITKNGRIVSKLSSPFEDRVKVAESLIGILPDDIDITDEDIRNVRADRLMK